MSAGCVVVGIPWFSRHDIKMTTILCPLAVCRSQLSSPAPPIYIATSKSTGIFDNVPDWGYLTFNRWFSTFEDLWYAKETSSSSRLENSLSWGLGRDNRYAKPENLKPEAAVIVPKYLFNSRFNYILINNQNYDAVAKSWLHHKCFYSLIELWITWVSHI